MRGVCSPQPFVGEGSKGGLERGGVKPRHGKASLAQRYRGDLMEETSSAATATSKVKGQPPRSNPTLGACQLRARRGTPPSCPGPRVIVSGDTPRALKGRSEPPLALRFSLSLRSPLDRPWPPGRTTGRPAWRKRSGSAGPPTTTTTPPFQFNIHRRSGVGRVTTQSRRRTSPSAWISSSVRS